MDFDLTADIIVLNDSWPRMSIMITLGLRIFGKEGLVLFFFTEDEKALCHSYLLAILRLIKLKNIFL